MSETSAARSEWARGWPLAIASLAGMMIASVALYLIGALIAPLEAEFGWSRAQISLGLTVSTLCGAVLSPLVGLMIDRWGPRRIGLPGAICALAALSLLSLTTGNPAVWLGLWFLVALFAVGIKPTVWTMAIASTFNKARGLAMAVALCGSSVAALVLPSLAIWLIDTNGWRAAIPLTSLIVGAVLVPILFFFFRSDADRARSGTAAEQPNVPQTGVLSVRTAVLSPQFAKIAGAAFVFTLCGLGMVSNLVPILTSLQFERTQAGVIAGLLGLASFTGRIGTGFPLDRFNSNLVAGSLVGLPVITCVLLLNAEGNAVMAAAAILIFGLAFGAEVDVIAYLTAEKFGTARYGTIFGFMTTSWYLATAAGPVLFSLVFDMTGNYAFALKAAIPLFALTSLLLFALGKPLEFDRQVSAEGSKA